MALGVSLSTIFLASFGIVDTMDLLGVFNTSISALDFFLAPKYCELEWVIDLRCTSIFDGHREVRSLYWEVVIGMSVNEIYYLSCRKCAQIFVAPLNTKYMVYLHESHNAILASSEGAPYEEYIGLCCHIKWLAATMTLFTYCSNSSWRRGSLIISWGLLGVWDLRWPVTRPMRAALI